MIEFLQLLDSDPNWQRANAPVFRGITRRFILSMALLSCAVVLLGLPVVQLGLAAFTPIPFEYRNLPFHVCGPASTTDACAPRDPGRAFHPGDVVPFIIDRCVQESFTQSAVVPYVVSRNVVNDETGIRIILPSLATEVPSGGCTTSITLAHQLPESITPGRYFFEGVATVYGRFRTVNAYFRTEVFMVSKP